MRDRDLAEFSCLGQPELAAITTQHLGALFLLERMGAVHGWERGMEDYALLVEERGTPEAVGAFAGLWTRLEAAKQHEAKFGRGSFLNLDHYFNRARYPHDPTVRAIYARYGAGGDPPNSQGSLNCATSDSGPAPRQSASASSSGV